MLLTVFYLQSFHCLIFTEVMKLKPKNMKKKITSDIREKTFLDTKCFKYYFQKAQNKIQGKFTFFRNPFFMSDTTLKER